MNNNNRKKQSKEVFIMRYVLVSICVSFFLFGALTEAKADNETLKILTEAISIIEKKHIAQPSLKGLVANAVKGMEEAIGQKESSIEKFKISWEDTGEHDKEPLILLETAYKFYLKNTTIRPRELISAAINGAIKVTDSRSFFLSSKEFKEIFTVSPISPRTHGEIGIEITKRGRVLRVISIEDAPAFKAGIRSGDRILMIEDKSTENISFMNAAKLLRGPVGTKVTLWIVREGFKKAQPFEIVRDVINIRSVKSEVLENGIGYVRITMSKQGTDGDLIKALKNLEKESGMPKALILDLRNGPSGLVSQSVRVSNLFLDKGLLVTYTKSRNPTQKMRYVTKRRALYPMLPLVVLINEGTSTGAEILAGALHDNQRALLLGSRTSGQAGIATLFPLKDSSALRLTTARYYTPSGHTFEGRGIKPDVEVIQRAEEDKPLYIARQVLKRVRDLDFIPKDMVIKLMRAMAEEEVAKGDATFKRK